MLPGVHLGSRPQAASLVRRDTPRNALLCLPTVLVVPHHRGNPTVFTPHVPNEPECEQE